MVRSPATIDATDDSVSRADTAPSSGGPSAPSEDRSVGRDSRTVAVGTLVSRITGLARVAVIAAVLGPTFFGNLFQTLNLVPNLLFELVVGALVASLLVPPLVARIDRGDSDATVRLARGFLGVAIALFGALGVVIVGAGPLLLRTLALGIDDPVVRDQYVSTGWLLLALLVPQVLLYAIAATGNAVLVAHGRLALTSAVPALENVGVVVTVLAFGFIHGFGIALSEITTDQILFIGIGTTISTSLHAIAQWIGAARAGVVLFPTAGWHDPDVREIARLGRASIGWASMGTARIGAALVVAGSIPGGVVAFQLALNAVQTIVALSARPTAMALLAPLSRSAQKGDLRRFASDYSSGVTLTLFLSLPAATALVVLGRPLARAVALGEMASDNGILLLTTALVSLGPAAIGDGLFTVATNACYARQDSYRPVRAMILRLLLILLGLGIAWEFLDGHLLILGIGLALTVADLTAAVVLDRSVNRAVGAPRLTAAELEHRMYSLLGGILATGMGLIALHAVNRAANDLASGRVALAVGGALAVGLYLLFKWALHSPELTSIRG